MTETPNSEGHQGLQQERTHHRVPGEQRLERAADEIAALLVDPESHSSLYGLSFRNGEIDRATRAQLQAIRDRAKLRKALSTMGYGNLVGD